MTVTENVAVAAHFGAGRRRGADASRRVRETLEQTGLAARAAALAGTLTIGELKRLEIARALATEPQVICLDEVMGGLNPAEIVGAMALIRSIRDSGVTVLMIEHHVHAVVGVSDRILVLNFGEKIAEGTPGAVLKDPAVISAYLGDEARVAGPLSLLEVRNIDVFYGDVQAVWDVSFRVEAGEIVTLIGANGAGKSTTLKTIAGLLGRGRDGSFSTGRTSPASPPNKLGRRGLVLVPEARSSGRR